jgi:hypothetical protein
MGNEGNGDKVLNLVMNAQSRIEAAGKAMQEIMAKYKVVPVIVEVWRGGTIAQQGIEWVPVESTQQKPSLLMPGRMA